MFILVLVQKQSGTTGPADHRRETFRNERGALHAIDATDSTTSPRRHRTGRVGKFLDQGPRLAPAKRRRRRAGDDVRAARASFVIIAGEPNPSPPLQHVEEQLFFVRGGFFTSAASRSKFSNIQRRSAAPSRRLWAGPFCSSRRPSRSASHESGR